LVCAYIPLLEYNLPLHPDSSTVNNFDSSRPQVHDILPQI
jgi:hypothetical protein